MNSYLRRGLQMMMIVSCTAFGAAGAAPAGSNPAVARALQPFVDDGTLAGVVAAAANKDGLVSVDALGYADLAGKTPMRPDTLFWIASQTKVVTAAALMMLVDEGKVHIDDPVEKYLPEFRGQMLIAEHDDQHVLLKHPAQPITVRHILTHTSGLPFASPLEQPTLDLYPLSARVHSYAMLPLEFEPGSRYQYSNEGINTAGRMIEVVSGMSYEDFLQQRLFDPLGMTDTTFWPSAAQAKRLAKTYTASPEHPAL
jgi:CubicO group peptidase (beta-lactamase class C family)